MKQKGWVCFPLDRIGISHDFCQLKTILCTVIFLGLSVLNRRMIVGDAGENTVHW